MLWTQDFIYEFLKLEDHFKRDPHIHHSNKSNKLYKQIKCPDPPVKVLNQTSPCGDGFRCQIPTPCLARTPTGFTLISALLKDSFHRPSFQRLELLKCGVK